MAVLTPDSLSEGKHLEVNLNVTSTSPTLDPHRSAHVRVCTHTHTHAHTPLGSSELFLTFNLICLSHEALH